MNNISAVIITKNEERNIRDCLNSINWCNEVVILDSNSTDNTKDISKSFENVIFFSENWRGFSKQRMRALELTKYNMVFVLDADERCSEELKEEILAITYDFKGYFIPRKSFFLGKWIRYSGWYPDKKLRLFDKRYVTITETEVHEKYEVKGNTAELKSPIEHYTVNTLFEFVQKINKYSTLSAIDKKSRKAGYLLLLVRPPLAFIREYFFRLGFLDGVEGLMVACFNMFTSFVTYAKINELKNEN